MSSMYALSTDHPELLQQYATLDGNPYPSTRRGILGFLTRMFKLPVEASISSRDLVRSGLFRQTGVWRSNRIVRCECGCTSTNLVDLEIGSYDTDLDIGTKHLKYLECAQCHAVLDCGNHVWKFDASLLKYGENGYVPPRPVVDLINGNPVDDII